MKKELHNLIRAHYREMKGYVSAGMEVKKDSKKTFLNANENPYELPGLEGCNRYPQPQPDALLQAYADIYGVQPANVAATRGADEAIVILTKLFCEPHQDSILIAPPTFGMYQVNGDAMPAHRIVRVPLSEEGGTFRLDRDEIIRQSWNVANRVKIIFLCSPNNPTGNVFPREDILKIARETEDQAVVVLDETYAEFSESGSLVPDLANHPNLIILRTLSKSYALAGMRMGCLICDDADFIALVRQKAMDAYPLPVASINAALHALSPEIRALAQENIRKLLGERAKMEKKLAESPLIRHIYPSNANFLLARMDKAREFVQFCENNNVIIRDFSTKPGTKGCIRLSIGMPEQNDKVTALLRQFEEIPSNAS